MTDPHDPNKQTPPLQARPAQRRPQTQGRRIQPPSKESQFVGYLVLGFGILAVITVIILAFSGSSIDTDGAAPNTAVTADLKSELSKDMKQPAAPKDAAKSGLAMARQAGIDINDLKGGWQATIGSYVAVLQMDKGLFQVILAQAEPGLPRVYSAGSYLMLDDMVVLKPRGDWSPAAARGSNIRYENLTAGTFPMIAGFKNGAMVWQNVPQSEKRIYVPSRSPLLMDSTKDYIVWKKVK